MKKIILIASLMLISAGIYAQSASSLLLDKDPDKRATARTDLLKSKLSLTDDQYAKVLQLNKQTANEMQPILFADDLTWYDKAMKAMPIVKKQRKELASMLTKEQRQQLDELKKETRVKVTQLVLAWEQAD